MIVPYSLLLGTLAGSAFCSSSSVIANLQALTSKSQTLQSSASSLNGINALVGKQALDALVLGLNDIATMAGDYTTELNNEDVFSKRKEVNGIFTAYADFTVEFVKLVDIIGNKGILVKLENGQTFATTLQGDGVALIDFADALTLKIPKRGTDVVTQLEFIVNAIESAIKKMSIGVA